MIGLGLGLVRQAVRNASGQAWTPAALFANGEQGVWYEPCPQYLYQDAAGTTPVTADGDPVGLMLDLSGNGNHATQSTSAARPTYHTDGTLHWLEFDGVDDELVAEGSTAVIESVYLGYALERADWSATNRLEFFVADDNDPGTGALNWGFGNGRLSHYRGVAGGEVINAFTVTGQSGSHVISSLQKRDSSSSVTIDMRFDGDVKGTSAGDYENITQPYVLGGGDFRDPHSVFGVVFVERAEASPELDQYLDTLAGVRL